MRKTGAILLSFILIFMMTFTNLAGAYNTASWAYAAGETDGGADNQDGSTQGGDETALTNTALQTGDVTQSGEPAETQQQNSVPVQQEASLTPPENNTPAATFTVTFDANGHGEAPKAASVTEGETVEKPDDPAEEGFSFNGWYRDKEATDPWDFDTDTVSGDIRLYASWTEAEPESKSETEPELTYPAFDQS